MTLDPVAARYAEALFGEVKRTGRLDDAAAQVEELGVLLRRHEELRRFLVNPDVEASEKARVLAVAFSAPWVEEVRAFVQMVLSMGRAEFLPGMTGAFGRLVDAERKLVRVTVRSARPLPASLRMALVKAIERREQRRVELVEEERPELLGGMQVLLDHRLLDGSLRTRLQELRRRLKSLRVS